MVELFEHYENEFIRLLDSLTMNLEWLGDTTVTQKSQIAPTIEQELYEAKQTLDTMELELRAIPPDLRGPLQNKLRSYSAQFVEMEERFGGMNRGKSDEEVRLELFGDRATDAHEMSRVDSEGYFDDGTDALHDASASLGRTRRMAEDTVDIGREILGDLGDQSEVMHNARRKLDTTQDNIRLSRKQLGTMARRVLGNRIVMFLVAVVLVAVICLVVYFRWIRPLFDKITG